MHAHPDDETLATGVAIAHHVARGDDVHVLTCTLGEEGEVIPAHLAHLEGAADDALAAHRLEELRGAMAVLGVTHHLLGAPDGGGRTAYRDSGMVGSAAAAHPRAWAGADPADAAAAVRSVLDAGAARRRRHLRRHRRLRPPRPRPHPRGHLPRGRRRRPTRPALYAVLTPLSWAVEDRAWLAEHVPTDRGLVVPAPGDPFPSQVVPDEVVTRAVVDPSVVPVQSRALRCHETQVVVGDGWYALSNHVVSRLAGREGYARIDAATGRPTSEGAP